METTSENPTAAQQTYINSHINGLLSAATGPNATDPDLGYAAWADKMDGDVHAVPMRAVTLAMKEPLGVIGIVAPEEAGLLGFVSTVMPAIAMGDRVVVVPSQHYALLATDFYQVLDTSDLPAGAVTILLAGLVWFVAAGLRRRAS